MIAFHCAKCGERVEFSENMGGQSVPCPRCREWVSIPTPSTGVPVLPAPTVPEARTNDKAIAALVSGLCAFFIGLAGFAAGIGAGILAVIYGGMAKSEIDKSAGRQKGEGLAICGIVLGVLGAVLYILVMANWNKH